MSVYDRFDGVDGGSELRLCSAGLRRSGACAELDVVSRDGCATIRLSAQDVRRLAAALIEIEIESAGSRDV